MLHGIVIRAELFAGIVEDANLFDAVLFEIADGKVFREAYAVIRHIGNDIAVFIKQAVPKFVFG